MTTSWHQLGTTRMAEAPGMGVCDPQGRVHGTRSLYMAGASLFPTGGRANPTLTAVALSLRLADHLKSEVPTL
jgi:choline dehydrogenase-like flavoprotein